MKISVEIIVQCEELQIQLGQSEYTLTAVEVGGDEVLIPDHFLGGIERQRVQQLQLRWATFVFGNLKKVRLFIFFQM